MEHLIEGHGLTLNDLARLADGGVARLGPNALERMAASRSALESIVASGRPAYGVNTGVGDLQSVRISPQQVEELQRNLVRSHACGVGELLHPRGVRAMMVLRANALALGLSGVRPSTVELLLDMLNADVLPCVPRQGSVGSSGDLAPLAHIALAMMGEGEVTYRGQRMAAAEALSRAGLSPVCLREKEGLALVNGTQYMTAVGGLAVHRALRLLKAAEVVVAMSVEALQGTDRAFDPRLAEARPHPGQAAVARHLRALLDGSEVLAAHRGCPKVQDAYVLRCAPQVLGAVRDALLYAVDVLEVEMNSGTDNPLLFGEEVVSGGNFHGQPVAFALDHAALAAHTIGAFAERRIARLVDGRLSGLPSFLIRAQGLESGMMVPQYVAASLVNENKLLSSPASADSLPTSANQEDYNSMGATAANKLERIVLNGESIVAIELLCASQALEFHHLAPGPASVAALRAVRSKVPRLVDDRPMSADIRAIAAMVADGSLLRAVEAFVPLD